MRRGWLMLVAGGLIATGCGGKSQTKAGTTVATAPTSATATTGTTSGSTDCNVLGINPAGMREGTCTHAGITYVIVDRNHTVRLRTLSANLDHISTASAVGGTPPTMAQSKFVVASITVTNHLELPQRLDMSGTQQAGLILDGAPYKEAVGVEKSSDPNSCLSQQGKFTRGASVTCEVVFEVPNAAAADLTKHGRADLQVVDFGSDLAGSSPPQTVGEIRLYR